MPAVSIPRETELRLGQNVLLTGFGFYGLRSYAAARENLRHLKTVARRRRPAYAAGDEIVMTAFGIALQKAHSQKTISGAEKYLWRY